MLLFHTAHGFCPAHGSTGQAVRTRQTRNSPHQANLALPSLKSAVRDFRSFTSDVLGRWEISEAERDSAVLIVSELTGNAATYGRASTSLCLSHERDTLRIEVTDSGAHVPDRRPSPDVDPDERGRGMDIVEVLAREVDVRQGIAGRTVHVALTARGPTRPDAGESGG